MVKITPEEIKVWSQYVYALCGIHLDESKAYLFESRLSTLMKQQNSASYSELYYKVKSDTSKAMSYKVVDAMTTGETFFFRDNSPFELLQHKILPDLIDRRNKTRVGNKPIDIRIWCAASSTGQEIYSIGITIKELLGDLSKYNIKILGTDISDQAIARASYAIYNKIEVERNLSKEKLSKYFTPSGDGWKVRDEIRAMATFKKLNLMEEFAAGLGKWDIVFCRNVAIYFTEADKIKLFNRIHSVMEPDGFLVIGSTESITGLCPQFEAKRHLKSIFYQKAGFKQF